MSDLEWQVLVRGRKGRVVLGRLWWAWDRFGWALVGAGFVAVGVLGLVGFAAVDGSGGLASRLYLTLQLFTMESGAVDGPVPWTLEVARWTAPLVLAGAAAGTVATLLRRRTSGWAARRYAGHLVVVGLGERGWQVVRRARKQGRRVAVVEADPDNPHVGAARRLGAAVVLGDGGDPERLAAAGTLRAARLVALTGDSGTGAEVAHAVTRLAARSGTRPAESFVAFVAVADAEAAAEVNALLHEDADDRPVHLEFFALDERAGPLVVDRWASLRVGAGPPPSLLLVGDSVAARSVVSAATRQWEAHRRDVLRSDDHLEVAWIVRDEQEAASVRGWAARWHPGLTQPAADGRPPLGLRACPPEEVAEVLPEVVDALRRPVGMVVLAEGDDAAVLRAATTAERLLRGSGAEVVALTGTARALIGLAAGRTRVRVLDLVEELCHDEAIARGNLEAMARALHDGYLRQLDATLSEAERRAKPAYVTWDRLAPELREQNHAAARALRSMLASHGYAVTPRRPATAGVSTLPDDVVDDLAQQEHHRWYAARHPGAPLPRWEDVDPVAVEQTRDQVRRIPATLAAAGLHVTIE